MAGEDLRDGIVASHSRGLIDYIVTRRVSNFRPIVKCRGSGTVTRYCDQVLWLATPNRQYCALNDKMSNSTVHFRQLGSRLGGV